MLDQYAVMGNPISHSKSPFIHSLFAKQTEQKLDYKPIHVELGAFESSVELFARNNGKGLNITVPFKQEAWKLVNSRSHRAEKAGAINTISIKSDGQLVGENTDGIGIVNDLKNNLGFQFEGKKILILGAGGAVRGVITPIFDEHPASIVIANRTVSKAIDLESQFSEEGCIKGVDYAALDGQAFDLIINGTAASLGGELPPISESLVNNACCYDMMYANNDTIFMAWAKQHGAVEVWDGLGMLVEQAAESFAIWRGVRPQTKYVIQQVRNAF